MSGDEAEDENDETDGENSLLHRHTTGEDRVRMVARQLTEPRTTNWIATEADWSFEPTKRVLERLVDDGVLHRDDEGRHTTYVPDYRHQTIHEATSIRDRSDSVEELTDRLTDMRERIREWQATFEVETPNQLRATLADSSLSTQEQSRRREIAREWEHLERRIEIVGFAIREWEFLSPDRNPIEASN